MESQRSQWKRFHQHGSMKSSSSFLSQVFEFAHTSFHFRDQLYRTPEITNYVRDTVQKDFDERTKDENESVRQWCEGIPFFNQVTPAVFKDIHKYLTYRKVPMDTELAHPDEDLSTFNILFSGSCTVTQSETVLCRLETGDNFGAASLLCPGLPIAGSFIAAETEVELLVLDDRHLQNLIRTEDNITLTERFDFISSLSIFASMQKERLQALAKTATLRSFPSNFCIAKQDQEAQSFFIIKSGECKFSRTLTEASGSSTFMNMNERDSDDNGQSQLGQTLLTPRTSTHLTPRSISDVRVGAEIRFYDVSTAGPNEVVGEDECLNETKRIFSIISTSKVTVLEIPKSILGASIVSREVMDSMKATANSKTMYRETRLEHMSKDVVSGIRNMLITRRRRLLNRAAAAGRTVSNEEPTPSQVALETSMNNTMLMSMDASADQMENGSTLSKTNGSSRGIAGMARQGAVGSGAMAIAALKEGNPVIPNLNLSTLKEATTPRGGMLGSDRGPRPADIPLSSRSLIRGL